MTLAKLNLIDKNSLDGKNYFTSLLDAALGANLLSAPDVEVIKMQCLQLLARKSHAYYSGDSSSIQTELAQNILESIAYTLGLHLKTMPPEDAITLVKQRPIADIYALGRSRIDTLLKVLRHLQQDLLANLLITPNQTYNDTCKGAVPGFLQLYRPDYGAHEIHVTADYPLYNPLANATGIEFMLGYTEALLLESRFCNLFSHNQIHSLLQRYHKSYDVLIINLFSQVLKNAIGCILCGTNPLPLLCPKQRVFALQSAWLCKTKGEIATIITAATAKLLTTLSISDEILRNYILDGLPEIASEVYLAIQTLTLETIFACSV